MRCLSWTAKGADTATGAVDEQPFPGLEAEAP
jgi:hypothetical protein